MDLLHSCFCRSVVAWIRHERATSAFFYAVFSGPCCTKIGNGFNLYEVPVGDGFYFRLEGASPESWERLCLEYWEEAGQVYYLDPALAVCGGVAYAPEAVRDQLASQGQLAQGGDCGEAEAEVQRGEVAGSARGIL
ncbi:MAG: hypothetical protein HC888_11815 [Candidatus Competibacteraceae bacterium]|nr:hypothetical protein [Candidatus Competibacteraceae bacterium]